MKLNRNELNNAFSLVSGLAGGATSLPILTCVRLTVEGSSLRLTASNIECFASAVVPCKADKAMDLCVNAKIFGAVIKSGGDEIEIKQDKERLFIDAGGTVKLATLPGEEHVPWPKEDAKQLGVNVVDMVDCIESTSWAAAVDSVDVLECVWLKTEAKQIRCACSDRKSIGIVQRSAIAANAEILLPAVHASRVCSALRSEGATVATSDRHLFVESPSYRLAVQLKEGRFPNVITITEQDWNELGEVSPEPLMEALQMARLIAADDPAPRIYLDMGPDGITVSFNGQTGEYKKLVPAKLTQSAKISLDAKKALNLLHNIKADVAKCKVSPMCVAFEYGDKFAALALMVDRK